MNLPSRSILPELPPHIAEQMRQLLFSSRPAWAMMPGFVAGNFVENLLFLLSALEQHGLVYTAHFGTLLGAVRLGGVCPWDEDADIYLVDEDRASVERKLRAVLEQHGFDLVYDERDFFWVRQHPWLAGQGHIGLSFLPPVKPAGSRAPDHPEDPRLAWEELYPQARHPFHGTWIWGSGQPEPILSRLYGETGSVATLSRFSAPRIDPEIERFWSAARGPARAPAPDTTARPLDWSAISARFLARRRHSPWSHFSCFPWWWWNGAYNIGIKRLRSWGNAIAASRTAP